MEPTVVCIIGRLFLSILLSLGKEEMGSRMHAAAPARDPWFGDSVASLSSTTSLWVFMENSSLQVSNMSTLLPLLTEEVFNLIQMIYTTYPLFTPHTSGWWQLCASSRFYAQFREIEWWLRHNPCPQGADWLEQNLDEWAGRSSKYIMVRITRAQRKGPNPVKGGPRETVVWEPSNQQVKGATTECLPSKGNSQTRERARYVPWTV